MEKLNTMCQSCGMSIKQDPQGGGTNTDGSKNRDYCSYCYQKGEFTFKGSLQDFREFCKRKIIESGKSKSMAWLFTCGIGRLKRWKGR